MSWEDSLRVASISDSSFRLQLRFRTAHSSVLVDVPEAVLHRQDPGRADAGEEVGGLGLGGDLFSCSRSLYLTRLRRWSWRQRWLTRLTLTVPFPFPPSRLTTPLHWAHLTSLEPFCGEKNSGRSKEASAAGLSMTKRERGRESFGSREVNEEISPSDVPWGAVENDTYLSGKRLSHERASESLNGGLGSGRDLIGPV